MLLPFEHVDQQLSNNCPTLLVQQPSIRAELGSDFFNQFQQYKIERGELCLFDITTGEDKVAAGVLYIAPYPWPRYTGSTEKSFNVRTLPGCQWKTVNVPMTNFQTSSKFPQGSIGNTQMLTVSLDKPAYMMNTRSGDEGSDTGMNRSDRFVLTNSHTGLDDGKWYGWLMEYFRYSYGAGSSAIKNVSFHFMAKYDIVLTGWRPVSGNSSSRRRRDVDHMYLPDEVQDCVEIYNSNGKDLERYSRDSDEDSDGGESVPDRPRLSSHVQPDHDPDEVSPPKKRKNPSTSRMGTNGDRKDYSNPPDTRKPEEDRN